MLPYCGRTMLEALMRDLQAREFLYYKLTGRQLTTPVAIMTSDAKGNNHRMLGLMESLRWFGRGKDAFMLFRSAFAATPFSLMPPHRHCRSALTWYASNPQAAAGSRHEYRDGGMAAVRPDAADDQTWGPWGHLEADEGRGGVCMAKAAGTLHVASGLVAGMEGDLP